jgi:hypothetical protein
MSSTRAVARNELAGAAAACAFLLIMPGLFVSFCSSLLFTVPSAAVGLAQQLQPVGGTAAGAAAAVQQQRENNPLWN